MTFYFSNANGKRARTPSHRFRYNFPRQVPILFDVSLFILFLIVIRFAVFLSSGYNFIIHGTTRHDTPHFCDGGFKQTVHNVTYFHHHCRFGHILSLPLLLCVCLCRSRFRSWTRTKFSPTYFKQTM